MGTTDLNTMLTSGGPYSLFAPNNLAFQANGYPDTTTINAANPDSLARILLYHIVPARMFTSDISSGQKSITLMDSTILFSSSGSTRQVVGNSNDVPANVLVSNTMGYNGVLYKIDEVLMP
jgi:uncharacterized surface protein with fasciclin (FAS1) repeats